MAFATTLTFSALGDHRGGLIAIEQYKSVPFDIKRVYFIFDTKKGVERGFHAHKTLHQAAVCVHGSCRILMDKGCDKEMVTLNRPDIGLLIPPMIWHEVRDFSKGCVLLVLASDLYDEGDYIRDYKQFLSSLAAMTKANSLIAS